MTTPREGYHTLVMQVPEVLWTALRAEADAEEMSATKLLTRILQERYDITRDQLPPPGRPGRRPKPRD